MTKMLRTMNPLLRTATIAATVLVLGMLFAIVCEHVALAAGAADAGSDAGSAIAGSGSSSGSAITPAPIVTDDPFISYLLGGKSLLAVGVALVGIVAFLRKVVLAKVAWFQTTLGGYVLGFGAAALTYIGTALQQGAPINAQLVTTAVVMAFAASGKWEMLRDVVLSIRSSSAAKAGATASVVLILGLGLGVGTQEACIGSTQTPGGGSAIISCTEGNLDKIAALYSDLKAKYEHGGDWTALEHDAETAGAAIGGCALAELVQGYLGGVKATPTDKSWQARQALEKFRSSVAHGATFHTHAGDL